MKQTIAALVSGVLFAVGLILSGMTQPVKVIGFLDFAGNWDPSLLFVLGAAASVYFIGLLFAKKFRAEHLQLPTRADIDVPLVAGAMLFGIGWGLAGYCPGASIAALGSLSTSTLTFLGAMLFGMVVHHVVVVRRAFLPGPPRALGSSPADSSPIVVQTGTESTGHPTR